MKHPETKRNGLRLTSDQKVAGSSPAGRTILSRTYSRSLIHRQSVGKIGAHLVVVDGVHESRHERDVDTGRVEVVERLQLDVVQVADAAVVVVLVADPVELQVREPQ